MYLSGHGRGCGCGIGLFSTTTMSLSHLRTRSKQLWLKSGSPVFPLVQFVEWRQTNDGFKLKVCLRVVALHKSSYDSLTLQLSLGAT